MVNLLVFVDSSIPVFDHFFLSPLPYILAQKLRMEGGKEKDK